MMDNVNIDFQNMKNLHGACVGVFEGKYMHSNIKFPQHGYEHELHAENLIQGVDIILSRTVQDMLGTY